MLVTGEEARKAAKRAHSQIKAGRRIGPLHGIPLGLKDIYSTKGVRTIKVTDRKGELVTARPVREGQELLLISQQGQVIRIAAESVRRTGRSTEGVRLMNLADDDAVVGVASVVEANGDDEAGDEPTPPAAAVDDGG